MKGSSIQLIDVTVLRPVIRRVWQGLGSSISQIYRAIVISDRQPFGGRRTGKFGNPIWVDGVDGGGNHIYKRLRLDLEAA